MTLSNLPLSCLLILFVLPQVRGWIPIPLNSPSLSHATVRSKFCASSQSSNRWKLMCDNSQILANPSHRFTTNDRTDDLVQFSNNAGRVSRRSMALLPFIFGTVSEAFADVQLTYGSGSFSGSSVVNGVLSAYGLPQLPDTKGFTPFLSQYQVEILLYLVNCSGSLPDFISTVNSQ